MSTDHAVETQEEECERLALRLIQVDKNNRLLAFFRHPQSGEEWRAIRTTFIKQFGPDGITEDECVGQHLAHFYQRLAGALRRELKELRVSFD